MGVHASPEGRAMCHEFYAVYPGALNGFRLSRKIIIQGYLGGGGRVIHGEANEKCIITTSAVGGQPKKHANASYKATKYIKCTFLYY